MVNPPPGTTNTAAPLRFADSGIKGMMAGLSSSEVPVAPGAPFGHRRIGSGSFCATEVNATRTMITWSKRLKHFIVGLIYQQKRSSNQNIAFEACQQC